MKGTLQEALNAAREQLGLTKPKDLLYMERDYMTVDESKALGKILGKSVVDEAKTNNYLTSVSTNTTVDSLLNTKRSHSIHSSSPCLTCTNDCNNCNRIR